MTDEDIMRAIYKIANAWAGPSERDYLAGNAISDILTTIGTKFES